MSLNSSKPVGKIRRNDMTHIRLLFIVNLYGKTYKGKIHNLV